MSIYIYSIVDFLTYIVSVQLKIISNDELVLFVHSIAKTSDVVNPVTPIIIEIITMVDSMILFSTMPNFLDFVSLLIRDTHNLS